MDELWVRPMTTAEFEDFRARSVSEYAAAKVRDVGWSSDQAEELAAKETDVLLPDGLQTPGMLLLAAETASAGVIGMVSVALEHDRPGHAWIFGIEIIPEQRRHGYGRSLLSAVEAEVERRGGKSIGLNVFGSNAVARHLYESSGYEITSLHMRKEWR